MSATVIDGTAGTISYYVYRVSDGAGGFQSSATAVPLSSYSFTNAYLGRSAFTGDNATSGSVDEFRVFDSALTADQVAADFSAGPATVASVPEPASLAVLSLGALGLLARRRRA